MGVNYKYKATGKSYKIVISVILIKFPLTLKYSKASPIQTNCE